MKFQTSLKEETTSGTRYTLSNTTMIPTILTTVTGTDLGMKKVFSFYILQIHFNNYNKVITLIHLQQQEQQKPQ